MTLVIAHRGASAIAYENSLAAFRAAAEAGADGIELDVHATADRVVVVHHDATIAGSPIAAQPLERVQAQRLPNGERVPTLAEALRVIGPDLEVFIEVKDLQPEADAALFDVMDGSPAPARCHVHAFDHRIVRRLVAARPSLKAGVLSASYPLDPAEPVRAAGAHTLWQQADLIDAPLVAQIHSEGLEVIAWTVNRISQMEALVTMGVDGLCTNHPDLAREVVA